jgi:hypothetical protein
MNDQPIIDIIAEAVEDAERSCGPREYWQFAAHVLASLRDQDYLVLPIERPVVVTQEALTNQPDILSQIQAERLREANP